MAVAKTARVVGTERLGPDTLLLDLCAAEPLGFVGGQYLILDSRIILPETSLFFAPTNCAELVEKFIRLLA